METQNIISILGLMVAAAGVFVTAFFSYMIWKTTKKIGENNELIQERIAKDNLEFQERLKTDNEKLMLYQHRLECFQKISNIITNFHNGHNIIFDALENNYSTKASLDKIFQDYQSTINVWASSKILFSPVVSDAIKELFENYGEFYSSAKSLMLDHEFWLELEKQAIAFCQKEQKELRIGKFLFVSHTENSKDMLEKFDNFKKLYESSEKLENIFETSPLRENILKEMKI